jgi:C-terminal processing protease CtpA/Prc
MRLNNDQERIEVVSVAADSPAARAGLQPSDLLLRIDGEALEEMQVLSQRIASKTRGSSMRLEIQRGDQRIEVEVRF